MLSTSQVIRSFWVFIKIYIIGIVIFTINRLALLFRFVPEETLKTNKHKLAEAFLMGFRFDTKVLFVLLLPLVLLSIFSFIRNERWNNIYKKITLWYCLTLFSIILFLLLVDQQYYLYFQSHFNVLIFALIQDDTKAIIVSMWNDHPFITLLLITAVGIFTFYKLFTLILKNELKFISLKWYTQLLFFLSFGFLLFSGIRGTYTTFPLEKDDLTISDDIFINYLASNAIFSIQTAIEDKSKIFSTTNNNQLLKDYGYNTYTDLLKLYYGDTINSYNTTLKDLFIKTPINAKLEAKPPHVVFVLMESMSNYYLNFHKTDSFNLLGRLEKHIQSDYFFRNFLSGENGTITSLENIMINMPEHAIAQSPYKYLSFLSSVAKPYKDAGYATVFITSGKQTWRNLDEFVPKNFFDTVYSKSTILSTIPGSTECEWGVYDEYMFDYVQQLLKKANKPTMLFVLTTTNHTPFERPKSYTPYPLILTNEMNSKISFNHQRAEQNFLNYQYANDALGGFMDKVKNSNLKENTIVAASGDHNNWMLFQFDDSQLHLNYGVPLYLYVPPYYSDNTTKNTLRFGSHKDIFTTLIPLSLSNTKYMNIGSNLLSTDTTQLYFGVNEKRVLISEKGVVKNFMSSSPEYFKWSNKTLIKTDSLPLTSQLKWIAEKAKAREVLLKYCFNEIIESK
ncbi:MAG: LTA synthase family protein [Cytophagaceae bacterium]|jgi:phosphoglycerol transferase MdoB-like AlkP superfamily enzyme|nr:LTA synthase family protein [Cytophagaceae bacterium]